MSDEDAKAKLGGIKPPGPQYLHEVFVVGKDEEVRLIKAELKNAKAEMNKQKSKEDK